MTLRLAISKPLLSCCYGSSKVVRKGLVVTHWRTLSGWRRAVSDAERVVGYPTSFLGLSYLLSDEISNVMSHFRQLASGRHIHPLFRTLRDFLFDGQENVHIRGLVILLISKATNCIPETRRISGQQLDATGILQSQRSLAEIAEMIHMGYLVHAGIVDVQKTVSNEEDPLVTKALNYGNTMSILGGDFLLANASTELAKLHNTKAVELISTAISEMMEGGYMESVLHYPNTHNNKQTSYCPTLSSDFDWLLPPDTVDETLHLWLVWIYLCWGSLLAKSCHVSTLLANQHDDIRLAASCYGQHFVITRQLSRDLQPFVGTTGRHELKPMNGVVIKAKSCDQLDEDADHDQSIIQSLRESVIVEDVREVCRYHGRKATESLEAFPASEAKDTLQQMVRVLVQ
ncbi:all trans-polyprenyl-diphosphate synthase PDSS2-like [Corticium candelabrum]|uniref:all trans-polyprenyl-diphosphate synthase PDSS2-like n=1 Tax=Corticium candelabrum TaxID=121492 RepID=UPI002E260EDB|nr:all trans-polyprenyl-diphosphate synthase PDSS2-like [Corticium candelabrum]